MANIHDVNESLQVQPSVRNLPTLIALSQGENGRSLQFRMVGATIPSGSSASLSGTKPDGVVYSKAGTVNGNTVIFQEDVQLTAVAGAWDAKIHIINSGNSVATALIRFVIDPDPVAAGAIPSDTQLEGIVAECKLYAEAARSNAYGSPLTASAAADMIDTAKVYVYTGDETGYTAGHWYYYNGTAWTDGGVYNSIAIQTDTTLTLPDHAADAKATGDALATKADKIGNIALAERLYGGEYTSGSEPYHFRQAPEGMGAKDETIVGGSLAWNQLMQYGQFGNDYATYWDVYSGTGSVAVGVLTVTDAVGRNGVKLRKYIKPLRTNHIYLTDFWYMSTVKLEMYLAEAFTLSPQTAMTRYSGIVKRIRTTETDFSICDTFPSTAGQQGTFSLKDIQLIDLTTLFGSTIADYIYSLEQATAGAGVAWVKRYIDLDTYHEYDAGSIQSVEGLESHNTYDEDENLIASYPLDSSVTLRGVPKLVTDHIEFDGDKYRADGTVERRYGIVDLGTLDWTKVSSGESPFFQSPLSVAYKCVSLQNNFLCAKYQKASVGSSGDTVGIFMTDNNYIRIRDNTYADATSFKTAMSGVMLVYELATPTTESAQPFQSPMIVGATEEYVSDSVVPVGHESKYYEDVAKKVSGLPKDFSTLIAPTEVSYTATRNYSVGSYLIVKNQLYKVTSAISSGGTITPNSNVTATTIMAEILALA